MKSEQMDRVAHHNNENPWGRREVWTHKGALAVGECRAFVDTNPTADSDARWAKAGALASEVAGDFFIDTLDPAHDAGLSESICSTMTAILFAYMNERYEHLRTRRIAEYLNEDTDWAAPRVLRIGDIVAEGYADVDRPRKARRRRPTDTAPNDRPDP